MSTNQCITQSSTEMLVLAVNKNQLQKLTARQRAEKCPNMETGK